MSSDFSVFDGSFYNHSSPEMVSSDTDILFSAYFPLFCDSTSIDMLQDFSNNQNTPNQVQSSNSTENYSSRVISSSPPSHQLENLTLYRTNQLQREESSSNITNCASSANGYASFSGLEPLEVKIEECQMGFESSYKYQDQSFMPHSYSGVENVAKLMQRSFSSNSFEGRPDFQFQPRFDTLMESPDYQNHTFSSPETNSLASQMRRASSTGDLQNIRTSQRSFSSPLASENSFMEEANFKVGRYSAEERKERISKYRAKRNQRNFTKTIKYACRKTLADNRPRIRGRFARNEEAGDIPKVPCSSRDEDEDELWFDGLQEEEDMRGSGGFANNCSTQQQFQYYRYGY